MMKTHIRNIALLCLSGFLASCSLLQTDPDLPTEPTAAGGGSGEITVETWNDISGTSIADLTTADDFPDNPSTTAILRELSIPVDVGDNYGMRIRGFLHPPASGNYTFFITSDDASELWLSTDTSPANKRMLAGVADWTEKNQWTKYSSQLSESVPLEAGNKYYVEVLYKEGGGGDHLDIEWQGPGVERNRVIGAYLSPWSEGDGVGGDFEDGYSEGYKLGYLDGEHDFEYNDQYPPVDNDQDGLPDNYEIVYSLNPNDPSDPGSDQDGDVLTAFDEYVIGTAPNNSDTEEDGIDDGYEVAFGFNPLNPADADEDADEDGHTNLEEYLAGTDPTDPGSIPESPRTPAFRINAGGPDYTDGAGNVWKADYGFNTGEPATTSASIANTSDPALFQSERWDDTGSPELRYTFDVENGDYQVTLFFSEVYSKAFTTGARVFSVTLNGQPMLSNFDIYASGGANSAVTRSGQVTVTDGKLNVDFIHVTENPKINAIEVKPLSDGSGGEGGSPGDGDGGTPGDGDGGTPGDGDGGTPGDGDGTTPPGDTDPTTPPDDTDPAPPADDAPPPSDSGSVYLSWNIPGEREDGSKLEYTELEGYIISYGSSPNAADGEVIIDDPTITDHVVEGLDYGETYYFGIQAKDKNGLTSSVSQIVERTAE